MFALRLLLLSLLSPSLVQAQLSTDVPTYYLKPLGELDRDHSEFACQSIRLSFGFRCIILRSGPRPQRALNRSRYQYDADIIVRGLFPQLPGDGLGLLALSNFDLYEEGRSRFVFGLASLVDRVTVVSMARFRGPWWGEDPDPARFLDRLHKVVIHEVAHTLGLAHCPDQHCAMREDRSLDDLDTSPSRFCARCQVALKKAKKRRPGDALWHYMRGHSHLNRGQLIRSLFHFERAVEMAPEDPRALNDLGVAYLRRGDKGRALWYFRHAQMIAPNFAYAGYNEGLLFLGAGDAEAAQGAFEAVLTMDANWSLAHRQLGYLSQVQGQPERALVHFEAYLDSHPEDSATQARVRMIKGGGRSSAP